MQWNPYDWYWLAEDGRVFSSARQALINDKDKTYNAWLKAGGSPTRWPRDFDGNQTNASLREVLQQYDIWQVPASISPRQLILGLLKEGFISPEEALAAAQNGAMPPAVASVVDTLPPAQKIVAQITWARMSVVERQDPLVGTLAQSARKSADEVDQLFAEWSKL